MANNEENDKELNDYLKGNSELSKAYRASNNSEPASELDNKILSAAKEAVEGSNDKSLSKQKFHKSPWVMPVSVAAMITLSVSLVVTMQEEAGRPLISEPEVELFDSTMQVEEVTMPAAIQSNDVVVLDEIELRQDKDVRVNTEESATYGAAADMYHAEEKSNSAKNRMKELPAKRILKKEKAQLKPDLLEKRAVLEEAAPAAPARREFDDENVMESTSVTVDQDNHLFAKDKILMNKDCSSTGLKEYKLTLSFSKNQDVQQGVIYLPKISEVKNKFCGEWNVNKLSDGLNHEYEGYKNSTIHIWLYPEFSDAGLTLEFVNFDSWLQQGALFEESFAGLERVGVFTIEEN